MKARLGWARGGGIGRAVGLGLCAGTTTRLIYAILLEHQGAGHDADRRLPSSGRPWGTADGPERGALYRRHRQQ